MQHQIQIAVNCINFMTINGLFKITHLFTSIDITRKEMKKDNGFTLIELLIVIAIIGILGAIAYPSYQDSIKKSRRADAQAALQGLAQAMERHYTTTGTYASAAAGSADTGAPRIYSTKTPVDGTVTYYNLKIASAGISSYIIGAEPNGAQEGDGVLLLRSTGARSWDMNNSSAGSLASFVNETTSSEQCWNC